MYFYIYIYRYIYIYKANIKRVVVPFRRMVCSESTATSGVSTLPPRLRVEEGNLLLVSWRLLPKPATVLRALRRQQQPPRHAAHPPRPEVKTPPRGQRRPRRRQVARNQLLKTCRKKESSIIQQHPAGPPRSHRSGRLPLLISC